MGVGRIFAERSIPSLYLWGAMGLIVLTALITALAVYGEYRAFDTRSQQLRRRYLERQKARIVFDTERVLRFIESEDRRRRGELDERLLQAQILSAIEELYGRPDGTGYIFIYDRNGTCLSDPIQRQNVGRNLYDFKDPDGVQVIRELIAAAAKPGGGFVRYRWIKPTTGTLSPKISYARLFEPWGWMVGTGVYLDEIDKVIAAQRAELREKSLHTVMTIVLLAAALFIVGLLGVRWLNGIIHREVERLDRHFERAARSHILIDEESIGLQEFRRMARTINAMVSGIHERKAKLRELNASLEEKVAEQTEDLRERNRQLQKEKRFGEALVQAQDSFIHQAIHEINTPLAVIMTHIDIFKMKYGQNRYLAKIEAASKMIATIYDDLSYMVKKNRLDYPKGEIDFSEFLRERIRFFHEIAQGNRLSIDARIEEGITLRFSDVELQRIIDNNLSNAVKYARAESYIGISLRRCREGVVLEFMTSSRQPIADTRKIFDAFHREDVAVEGFGLGLQIVQSICRKNGVEVAVESDETRTLFRYIFTAEEQADARPAA